MQRACLQKSFGTGSSFSATNEVKARQLLTEHSNGLPPSLKAERAKAETLKLLQRGRFFFGQRAEGDGTSALANGAGWSVTAPVRSATRWSPSAR